MGINRVCISGNLTRDPQLRASQSGTSVLSFGMAVNERTKQPDGNWGDKANFVDCVVFGNRADALAKFLTKGTKVAIEGRLSYSSWEKDGQKRSKLEVIVDDLELMSRKNTQETTEVVQEPFYATTPSQPTAQPQTAQYDADIPF